MSVNNHTNTSNDVNDVCKYEETTGQYQHQEPTADQDQEPTADQDQEPTADQDQDQEPSADKDNKPSADKDNKPSADTEEPSADKDNKPSADKDNKPSADTEEPSADPDKGNTRNQLNEIIQIVCRQTELTEEEARERLEKEQYNHMKVLNDYFGFKEVTPENKSTINQQIYGEIRSLMDTSSRNFRLEQENAQCIQKLKETRGVNKE